MPIVALLLGILLILAVLAVLAVLVVLFDPPLLCRPPIAKKRKIFSNHCCLAIEDFIKFGFQIVSAEFATVEIACLFGWTGGYRLDYSICER